MGQFPLTLLLDDLLVDEGPRAVGVALALVEVGQGAHDGADVLGPHVLAGVDAEAGHAELDEVVHEGDDLGAGVVATRVHVDQTEQLTVAHLTKAKKFWAGLITNFCVNLAR